MSNLDDVLVKHRHMPCCMRDTECDCTGDPIRKPEGCKECDYFCSDIIGCPRCAQENLLTWLRGNCKDEVDIEFTVTKTSSDLIKENTSPYGGLNWWA